MYFAIIDKLKTSS